MAGRPLDARRGDRSGRLRCDPGRVGLRGSRDAAGPRCRRCWTLRGRWSDEDPGSARRSVLRLGGGARARRVESHARDIDWPDDARSPPRAARCAGRPGTWSTPWTSASSSTRCASCSRSATASPTAPSTPSRYDLLASEARLASFVAIAKGDVPVSHWFRLGRALTPVERDSVLVSWSGSMFEYLMPRARHAGAGREPARADRAGSSSERQITYGAERGVPWGVSESGYNVRDLEMTYQYSNFGVPGLGLRRGLSEDVVIAPYATGLAAMIDPAAAVRNFRRLAAAGASGALRLLRGARLHRAPAARRAPSVARGARLHGAPPGHD